MAADKVNELGRHYTPISASRCRRRREMRTARPGGRAVRLPQLRKLG